VQKVGIGIIGCGNISTAYLKAASLFPVLDIRGLADANHEAAIARAKTHRQSARILTGPAYSGHRQSTGIEP